MFDLDDAELPRILSADDVLPPVARESRTARQIADSLARQLTTPIGPGIYTGVSQLDAALGAGLQPGEMAIIAADTGVGKSLLGFQVACHNAALGMGRVLYVSAEMPAEALAMRFVTSLTEVPVSRQRGGYSVLTDDDWTGGESRFGAYRLPINEALAQFAALDLEILDSGDFTMDDLEREVLTCENPRMVCIDYAQLIDTDGRTTSQAEAMKSICKRLRKLALRRLVIIAMAQINRAVEGRADKELRLSDIAETGSLAKDASLVMMLERNLAGQDRSHTTVRIRKNRHGEPATVNLRFNAGRLVFEDMR